LLKKLEQHGYTLGKNLTFGPPDGWNDGLRPSLPVTWRVTAE
jgi:hypothetical protein